MSQTLWTRLDATARHLSPFALTILVVMLAMVPLRVPNLAPIMPALGLIAVYFWLVHHPDLMPAWAVFVIGLVQDLLRGGPLGVGVFVLLAVYAALAGQRRFLGRATFLLVWLAFLPIAAGAFLLSWGLNSLIVDAVLDPGPAFFQYLTTVGFYPCLAWIFLQAQRAFLR